MANGLDKGLSSKDRARVRVMMTPSLTLPTDDLSNTIAPDPTPRTRPTPRNAEFDFRGWETLAFAPCLDDRSGCVALQEGGWNGGRAVLH